MRQADRDGQVEVWAFDEHRLGLKPILRKIWAKRGQRPTALSIIAISGSTCMRLSIRRPDKASGSLSHVSTSIWFIALQEFAKEVGAGANKRILLVLDGTGWHRSAQVVVPEGIHLEFLPPYSSELQPAERLWQLTDEPLVNCCFTDLDALEDKLCNRCVTLSSMPQVIRQHTLFH